LDALAYKRSAYWHNAARNDRLAAVARAMADRDRTRLQEMGLRLDPGDGLLPTHGQPCRIIVLVEAFEQGLDLLRRLPAWELLGGEDGRLSRRNGKGLVGSIVTLTYAAHHDPDADVLILTSPDGLAGLEGFPPRDGRRQRLLLVDVTDDFDKRAQQATRRRISGYRARGWTILGAPNPRGATSCDTGDSNPLTGNAGSSPAPTPSTQDPVSGPGIPTCARDQMSVTNASKVHVMAGREAAITESARRFPTGTDTSGRTNIEIVRPGTATTPIVSTGVIPTGTITTEVAVAGPGEAGMDMPGTPTTGTDGSGTANSVTPSPGMEGKGPTRTAETTGTETAGTATSDPIRAAKTGAVEPGMTRTGTPKTPGIAGIPGLAGMTRTTTAGLTGRAGPGGTGPVTPGQHDRDARDTRMNRETGPRPSGLATPGPGNPGMVPARTTTAGPTSGNPWEPEQSPRSPTRLPILVHTRAHGGKEDTDP
jgi:hypothetical protein